MPVAAYENNPPYVRRAHHNNHYSRPFIAAHKGHTAFYRRRALGGNGLLDGAVYFY